MKIYNTGNWSLVIPFPRKKAVKIGLYCFNVFVFSHQITTQIVV